MTARIIAMLALVSLLGCSSKQQVIEPTATIVAPTGELKLLEMGGGGGIPAKGGNPKN